MIALLASGLAALGATSATVTLTPSPSPVTFGVPATLTAAVNPPAATGTVTFYDGATILGTKPVVSGSATLVTTLFMTGAHSLTARYSGDGSYSQALSPAANLTVDSTPSTGFTVAPQVVAAAGQSTLWGDFNGDGISDLVSLNGSAFGIALGTGDGNFGPITYYAATGGAALADFNLDQKLDLVIGNQIFLGIGDGTFQTPMVSADLSINGGPASELMVSDYNGDGIPDIAGIVTAGNIAIFLGSGTGTFTAGTPISVGDPAIHFTSGDFNGDGIADLAVTRLFGFGLAILLGNGDGTFQSPVVYTSIYDPSFVVSGDFNGDGKLDLAVSNNYAGFVTIFLGLGDGTFGAPMSFDPGGSEPRQLVVNELNGDGKLDIAVANGNYPAGSNIGLMYGNGDGTFQSPVAIGDQNGGYVGINSGEFNGDGRIDLAVVNGSGIQFFEGASSPALRVSLTHTAAFPVGGTGTYTAVISNASTGIPTSDTVFVSILPGLLPVVSVSGAGWFCETALCFRSDVLRPGASYPPITIVVTVPFTSNVSVETTVSVSTGTLAPSTASDFTMIPGCTLSLSPQVTTMGAAGGTAAINVTSSGPCSFSAVTNAAWMTPPWGVGGYAAYGGTFAITYFVEQNPSPSPRTGTISIGAQTFTLTQSGTSGPHQQPPQAVDVTPGGGTGTSQTLTFTFSDTDGYQDLNVMNVLIRDFLDGDHACYLAYSRPLNVLYLVNDSGTALLPGLTLNGSGSINNSQCGVSGIGSSAEGNGSILTLTLNMTFSGSFAGNKVIYTAAGNMASKNTGWQAVGVWNVPGTASTGPAVGGVSPPRSSGTGGIYGFTFTDPNGFSDLGVVNILINDFLDGDHACYIAYSRPQGVFYLVNDAGNALLPPLAPGLGTLGNSQCTIVGAATSVNANNNTLTITLELLWGSGFAGNRVIYGAARSNGDVLNSGWQAVGTVNIP